jgi:phosphatidylglycerol:prolipoprotein diacylglycerol transferase
MIDPIIFSFKLFNWVVTLRWYGVLVMFGAVVGTWIAEKEVKRRGENGDVIWDGLVWILPTAIVGARIWYIVNSIVGGSAYYLDNPVKMLYITEGGLHFFGGLIFGAAALYYFLKRNGMDFWLFLDAIAPAALIGQALARPANFINQELYGPPTKLPWGILINNFQSRLSQYSDLTKYPLETTHFHPTFAYEMILNILAALLLLWISREHEERMKPGAIFAGWLISAGLIRAFIEFFRPDQPRIANSFVTTSMLVSFLMAVAGVVMLLIRYGKLKFALAENWEAEYFLAAQQQEEKPARSKGQAEIEEKNDEQEEEPVIEEEPVKKKPARKPAVKKPSEKDKPAARTKRTKKE